VAVSSRPSGAQVFVGDEPAPRGVTPTMLALPAADGAVVLTLRAPGYVARTLPLPLDRDRMLEATLVRVPVAKPPATAKRHPTRPVDLEKGDVLDPFRKR
jgi:hypothetical protein